MWDCFILSWTRAAHSSCTILSFPFTFETLFKMGKQKFFFQMHSWKLEHLTLRQFERKRIKKKEEKSCWKRSKLASEISASLPADSCLTIVPEIFHWNPREVTECPFNENIVLFLTEILFLSLTEILAWDLYITVGCDSISNVIWRRWKKRDPVEGIEVRKFFVWGVRATSRRQRHALLFVPQFTLF